MVTSIGTLAAGTGTPDASHNYKFVAITKVSAAEDVSALARTGAIPLLDVAPDKAAAPAVDALDIVARMALTVDCNLGGVDASGSTPGTLAGIDITAGMIAKGEWGRLG